MKLSNTIKEYRTWDKKKIKKTIADLTIRIMKTHHKEKPENRNNLKKEIAKL